MKGYIYILLAGVSFGLVGPLVKLIDGSIPAITLCFFRSLIGLVFILALLPFIDRNTFRVKRTDLKAYIIIGILMAVNFSLFVTANYLAPVSNVVLLFFTFPFWLAIISYFFLRERVTKYMIICLLIAFAGIFAVNPFQGIFNLGNIFALINGLNYAVIVAYMRYIDKRHHIGVVFWFLLSATIFLSPAPFIYGLGTFSWNYIWVLVMGIISTGLAYLFLNYGLEKIQAEASSLIIMTTEPVVAIVLSIIIIGEILSLNVLAGGILIIAAGMILEKKHGLTKR